MKEKTHFFLSFRFFCPPLDRWSIVSSCLYLLRAFSSRVRFCLSFSRYNVEQSVLIFFFFSARKLSIKRSPIFRPILLRLKIFRLRLLYTDTRQIIQGNFTRSKQDSISIKRSRKTQISLFSVIFSLFLSVSLSLSVYLSLLLLGYLK